MKNQYRTNRWVAYREELIELDGGACVKCGRTREAGAILQVHHKKYIAGKAPWEYPYDLCETLCKRCHAAEHGEIRPESGWEYVGEDDLGGLYGTCDRCGTNLRYVFFVQHPNWESMSVGTVCCDDMTCTQIASEKRKYDDRLKLFIKSKRWTEADKRFRIKQKQIEIQIIPANSGYSIHMNSKKGKTAYPTLDAAKTRVFDFIESGDADKYFKRKA